MIIFMLQLVVMYHNILVDMKVYNVTVQNSYNSQKRVMQVEGADPMTAHKTAYTRNTTSDEEIITMVDDNQQVVFTLVKGFLQ
jgi:hypothetical protein